MSIFPAAAISEVRLQSLRCAGGTSPMIEVYRHGTEPAPVSEVAKLSVPTFIWGRCMSEKSPDLHPGARMDWVEGSATFFKRT